MCVNLAVDVVDVPFENELIERDYDRIVFVGQNVHACYYEAEHNGVLVEVKVAAEEEGQSIKERVQDWLEGRRRWRVIDYIN